MKKHKTSRKKKTLKKYSKTQFRRFNKQTTLTNKMKGGDSKYIRYRKEQLASADAILSNLPYIGQDLLKSKIVSLKELLKNHIKIISEGYMWDDSGAKIDKLITIINKNLGTTITPISIITNTRPVENYQSFIDDINQNDSPSPERSINRNVSSINRNESSIKRNESRTSINRRGSRSSIKRNESRLKSSIRRRFI
jgi:hypothetical protein